MVRKASPHLPPRRFASLPRWDKLVRKYTSSTSKGRGLLAITNCNWFGSKYPINNYSREVSDLMDEIWKYFNSPYCLKALNMSRCLSASLSAPWCSRSCHSITIMSRPASKHQSSSSATHFTKKMLEKTIFLIHTLTFLACSCMHTWPSQGSSTCTSFHTCEILVGPVCAQVQPNGALLL